MTILTKFSQLFLGLVTLFGSVFISFILLITSGQSVKTVEARSLATATIHFVAPEPFGDNSGNNCQNNMTPCATIQHAVDQALPRDEIRVAAGVYEGVSARVSALFPPRVVTQSVYISKPISLVGGYTITNWTTADPALYPTIIDAQNSGRVLNIESPSTLDPIRVVIDGFHILNGNASGLVSSVVVQAGGGIHGAAVTATLRNNYIAHNHGVQVGGGLMLVGGYLELINNSIISNSVELTSGLVYGGGAFLATTPFVGEAILSKNLFQGNQIEAIGSDTSGRGGGLYLLTNRGQLNDMLILSNEINRLDDAVGRGAGIYLDSGQLTITNTVFNHNKISEAGDGVALTIASNANAHLVHTTFSNNQGGSGIAVLTSTAHLTNVIISSHTLGISVMAGSTTIVDNVLWFNNQMSNTFAAGTLVINNELTGDPTFLTDTYHLGENSLAIDQGVTTDVMIDIDGEIRTSSPDLGADEFVGNLEESKIAVFLPIIFR